MPAPEYLVGSSSAPPLDDLDDEWNDPPDEATDAASALEGTEPIEGRPDSGPPPEPGP